MQVKGMTKSKSKRPSEASIRRKSFLYSCESVPSILITTVINTMPKDYMGNNNGNSNGNNNGSNNGSNNENSNKKVEEVATTLRKFLTDARMRFPNMSILEWYEMTLVCFKESSNEAMKAIDNSKTKTWMECRTKFKDSLEFATKVIEKVRKIRKRRYEIF
uniref:Uncharacterized protein n=1 Tax=viral metagenome TaxID=1070528 RepID=A0A6H1ZXG3_9ZZZZ